MKTAFTIDEKDYDYMDILVHVKNNENEKDIYIQFSEINGDVTSEAYTTLMIDYKVIQVDDAEKALKRHFPTTYKEINNRLNEIAEENSLDCIV